MLIKKNLPIFYQMEPIVLILQLNLLHMPMTEQSYE